MPVIVNAVADAPSVANTSSTVDEDTATVVGDAISYGLVDTDGSEVIPAVTVTGIPVGATYGVTPSGTGTAVVTPLMGGGGFTITGTEADIRATLDSFTFTPAANDDSNVTLGVAVTATDSNGDTATTSSVHTLNVAAIADAPVGSGTGTGNEDTAIAVPVSVGVSDTDGSETITQVMIEAPAGVVLGGFGPSGASVNQAGQTLDIDGDAGADRGRISSHDRNTAASFGCRLRSNGDNHSI
ncbi:MAG: hypothetical protein U5K75_11815 [Ahrensia sp.]|nr:hypothetical protein [Ahrensia sp.]